LDTYEPKNFAQAVTLLICIRGVIGSNLGGGIGYLD
jgi:hypothetical protein